MWRAKIHTFLMAVLLCAGSLAAQAQKTQPKKPLEKPPGLFGRGYHNLHAYFNGYWNAKQRYKEALLTLEKNTPPNETGFLNVVDEAPATPDAAASGLLEEAIKKCEIMIFRHKKSNMVDDARFLIGRCNYYERKLGLAQQNFEYIPLAFPKSPIIPDALLWQAKVQQAYGNTVRARSLLGEVFKQKRISQNVKADASLLSASLLVDEGDYNNAIKVLDDNLTSLRTRKQRTRAYFLLGQLYEKLGVYSKAVASYTEAAHQHYTPLLTFRAELALIRLNGRYLPNALSDPRTLAQIKKLEQNGKYADYRDQLYYERAALELARKNYPEALVLLKKSLAFSTTNVLQKALSYAQVGEIYFYNLDKLEPAQAYLDSAAALMKPTFPDYKKIKTLALSLDQYRQYRQTINDKDSLLTLAALTPGELDNRINQRVVYEDAAKAEAEARKQRAANQGIGTGLIQNISTADFSGGQSSFYFDNPQLVQAGRANFIALWGNRPNRDNWRHRSFTTAIQDQTADVNNPNPAGDKQTTQGTKGPTVEQRKAAMRKQVPADAAAKEAALAELMGATFGLATLYAQELNRPEMARTLYEGVVAHYPGTDYVPEAYYGLYRLYNEKDPSRAAPFAALIRKDYGQTIYAQLLNGGEGTLQQSDMDEAYSTLYALYTAGDYKTVLSFSSFLANKYPKDELAPKLYYLRGLSFGHLEQKDSMRAIFVALKQNYPTAPATLVAKHTLDIMDGKPEPVAGGTTPKGNIVRMSADPEKEYLENEKKIPFTLIPKAGEGIVAILLLDRNRMDQKLLQAAIESFNADKFPQAGLSTNLYGYQDKRLVYVSTFANYGKADAYLVGLEGAAELSKIIKDPRNELMFMSVSNFHQAFTKRRFAEYSSYFQVNREAMVKLARQP